jgi:uncharacterized surface protein with fasciclin (FAS1) repeats
MKSSPTAKSRPVATLLLASLLLGLLSAPTQAKPAKLRDLADTVAANPILTKFAAMVQASDLGTFLSSRGPFTLFVPTDSAFSKLPPGMLDTLLRPENKVRLQDILLFHVVTPQRLTAKDLLLLKSVLSCQGNPLTLKTSRSGAQFVMDAKIVHADIKCQNGILNEIDTVLMPPESALPPIAPPPPPAPPAPVHAVETNAAPSDTNAPPAVPVAPIAAPSDTNAPPAVPVAPIAAPSDTNAPPVVPAAPVNAPH